MSDARLEQAVALVTGASSGIGQALARALAARGARLVLVARDAARLAQVQGELARPGSHEVVAADLADAGALEQVATRTLEHGRGRLDVLIHSAACHELGPIDGVSSAALDRLLATNLRAPFLLTGALLPALRLARGDVVFVNSSVVGFPRRDVAAYAASKAGLRAFADNLRAEVNADGVRVLSVFPGRTATPMQREQSGREGSPYQPERLLQPEDIAAAVLNAICLSDSAELTELHVRPRLKS